MSRRLRSIGVPYLLASAAGLLLATHGYPSMSILHLLKVLAFGKAYYHLYFVLLIAQLYLLLPIAVRPFHRPRSITTVLAGAAVLQLAVYWFNRWGMTAGPLAHLRELGVIPSVGSMLGWYVLPIALGLWMLSRRIDGGRGDTFSIPVLVRYRQWIFWSTMASMVVYLPLSVLAMVGPVNTFACQWASWAFTAGASLLLVLVGQRVKSGRGGQWLAELGRRSLTIYFAHPFVIAAIDMVVPDFRHANAWIAAPLYACAAIGGCVTVSKLAGRLAPQRSAATSIETPSK